MSNLDDMRRLKEEIITSFDERLTSIANVVESTSDMVKSTKGMTDRFRQEHGAMKNNLNKDLTNLRTKLTNEDSKRFKQTQKEFKGRIRDLSKILKDFRPDGHSTLTKSVNEMLSNFRTVRLNEFDLLMNDLNDRVTEIRNDVADKLNEFHNARGEMSQDMMDTLADFKSNLKNFRSNLSQEETERYQTAQSEIEERATDLNSLFSNVSNLINEFRADHQLMTKNLKELITFKGFNKERLQDFQAMMDNILTRQQERNHDTKQLLTDFQKSHQEMSKNLSATLSQMKSDLEKMNSDRKNSAYEQMKHRLGYLSTMKSDISNMLTKVREEGQAVALEWQNLAKIIEQKKSQDTFTEAETKPETAAGKPRADQAKQDKPTAVNSSHNGNAKKIYSIITERGADGIKLTEIGKLMNQKWQGLIPLTKELIADGKIRKENSLYFPM